jgi:O-antigen/teichoic acid export membrane protein
MVSMKFLDKLFSTVRNTLPQSVFFKNISLLLGGTIGSQILLVFASPILTRVYSPEAFGNLAVFISIVVVTSMVATMRYELAIPLPKNTKIAHYLVALSIGLSLVISFLIGILVFVYGDYFFAKIGMTGLQDYYLLIPLGVLFFSLYNTFLQLAIRQKKYAEIAKTKIVQVISTLLVQLLFFRFGVFPLLLGHVAGIALGSYRLSIKRVFTLKIFNFQRIKLIAVSFNRFPKFSMPAGFLRVLGVELPVIILTGFYSPAAAGLYALANRVLNVPVSAIGNAVSQVFITSAVTSGRDGSLGKLVSQVHSKMTLIGMPLALVLVFIGPEIFHLVFGEAWRKAGSFAQWMAPWLYLVFVSAPLTTLTAVLGKQKQGLIFNGVLFFLRLLSLYAGVKFNDLYLTVTLYCIVNILWRLAFSLWLSCISGNGALNILRDHAKAFLLSILFLVPLIFDYYKYGNSLGLGLMLSVLVIFGYYFNLLRNSP